MAVQLKRTRIAKMAVPSAIIVLCALMATSGIRAQSQDNPFRVYTGHFSFGVEVSSFLPCGSDVELWVSERSSVYDILISDYLGMTTEPYEPVLLQVEGQRQGAVDGAGFANEYEDEIVVSGIIEMRPSTEIDCQ